MILVLLRHARNLNLKNMEGHTRPKTIKIVTYALEQSLLESEVHINTWFNRRKGIYLLLINFDCSFELFFYMSSGRCYL